MKAAWSPPQPPTPFRLWRARTKPFPLHLPATCGGRSPLSEAKRRKETEPNIARHCTDLLILFWDGAGCLHKWKLDARGDICKSGLNYDGIFDLVTSIVSLSVSANLHAEKLDTLKWNKWELASVYMKREAAFWASEELYPEQGEWQTSSQSPVYTTVSTPLLIHRILKCKCATGLAWHDRASE